MWPHAFCFLAGLAVVSVGRQTLAAAIGTRSPSGLLDYVLVTEKPGQCPPAEDPAGEPSMIFCFSDASCPAAEKCCLLGPMLICVQPAMVGLGYCPRLCLAAEEPCLVTCLDDTWCGPLEKCCRHDCHMRCVLAEPARPGVCPRKRVPPNGMPCPNRCEDDRSCPEGQKCCFTGCGLECVTPAVPTEPQPCPEASRPETPKCHDLCAEDADCLGSETCVRTDCGHQCRGPFPTTTPSRAAGLNSASISTPGQLDKNLGTPSALPAKPGRCPLLLRGSMGPCPGLASRNCSNDFDCEDKKKCCSAGCSWVCREPVEVRPGSCPLSPAWQTALECVSFTFCIRDSDCSRPGEKCCWLSCGWVCMAATGVPGTEPSGGSVGDQRNLAPTERSFWALEMDRGHDATAEPLQRKAGKLTEPQAAEATTAVASEKPPRHQFHKGSILVNV